MVSLPDHDRVYLEERGIAHLILVESGMTCVPDFTMATSRRFRPPEIGPSTPAPPRFIRMFNPICGGSIHQSTWPTGASYPRPVSSRGTWAAGGNVGHGTSTDSSGSLGLMDWRATSPSYGRT